MAQRRNRRHTLVKQRGAIRIYYEGSKALKPGFDIFFGEIKELARGKRCEFRLIDGGSRDQTKSDFKTALKDHPDALNVLLIDSEGPLAPDAGKTLCGTMHWPASRAEYIFWMVEMMESWFHADKEALEAFYGEGFNRKALKQNSNVEKISKNDLTKGLKSAIAGRMKGEYDKTEHAQKLLALIDPKKVRSAAPNCNRIFEVLLRELA
jgi:hypothetical protein